MTSKWLSYIPVFLCLLHYEQMKRLAHLILWGILLLTIVGCDRTAFPEKMTVVGYRYNAKSASDVMLLASAGIVKDMEDAKEVVLDSWRKKYGPTIRDGLEYGGNKEWHEKMKLGTNNLQFILMTKEQIKRLANPPQECLLLQQQLIDMYMNFAALEEQYEAPDDIIPWMEKTAKFWQELQSAAKRVDLLVGELPERLDPKSALQKKHAEAFQEQAMTVFINAKKTQP